MKVVTRTVLVAVLAVLCMLPIDAFVSKDASVLVPTKTQTSSSSTSTCLHMGLINAFRSRFGNNGEEGDFVKLDKMKEEFIGPGPVVLLYRVPPGIDDDEVLDILYDAAPMATKKGIAIARIAPMKSSATKKVYSLDKDANKDDDPNEIDSDKDDDQEEAEDSKDSKQRKNKKKPERLVNMNLKRALETVIKRSKREANAKQPLPPPPPVAFHPDDGSPVVIFSGFTNREMMDSYNVLGEEVYKEGMSSYGKGQYLACATAVPNAMKKPLKRVLEEISGDHAEALASASAE